MRTIDVCLSPDLLNLYDLRGKIVVVVDILRATSCITTAMAHGIKSIIPVATLEECQAYHDKGYITAAERDGQKAEGFDLGNSPFGFMDSYLTGKSIAMTTTNGTIAINLSRSAEEIIIGSFLNMGAVADYLLFQPYNVLIVCAGWKGKPNMEDTLFAGALVEHLKGNFSYETDAPIMASTLYNAGKHNMVKYLSSCTHIHRLHRLGIFEDIEFCLTRNLYDVVPVLQGNELVRMDLDQARQTG